MNKLDPLKKLIMTKKELKISREFYDLGFKAAQKENKSDTKRAYSDGYTVSNEYAQEKINKKNILIRKLRKQLNKQTGDKDDR